MQRGVLTEGDTLNAWLLAYCARLREMAETRRTDGPLDLGQERARLTHEQRTAVEIKNNVLREEYACVDLLNRVLAQTSAAVAERIELLPGRIASACLDLSAVATDLVNHVINTARDEWVSQTAELMVAPLELEDAADQDDDGEDAP